MLTFITNNNNSNSVNNISISKEAINNFMRVIWEKLIKLQLKYMLHQGEKLLFNCGE
jgi:hypothetical protein